MNGTMIGMTGKALRAACVLALILLASPLHGQRPITIRMASPVPENTPWGQFLNLLADDWRRITNGQVDMVVFHNRTAGTEESVVRRLRQNQLQAASLSTFGLTQVVPEVMTISCPFFIRSDEELDLVMAELQSELDAKIAENGFFNLAWTRVGWVNFFSKTPILVPDDLKRQRLGTISEYESLNQAFRTMGFQMVPVAQNEVLIALNSPMVDAVYHSPAVVGNTQIFGLARNMASIKVAPFMGAVVFNRRAWNSIPDNFKPQLIAITRQREAELDAAVREFEENVMAVMQRHGLAVNQLSPAQEQLWYDEVGRAMPQLVGTLFDRSMYNRIEAILTRHRNQQR